MRSSSPPDPGIHGAMNFGHGVQVVPGVGLPLGLGPSRGGRALFLYLSVAHPFAHRAEEEKAGS